MFGFVIHQIIALLIAVAVAAILIVIAFLFVQSSLQKFFLSDSQKNSAVLKAQELEQAIDSGLSTISQKQKEVYEERKRRKEREQDKEEERKFREQLRQDIRAAVAPLPPPISSPGEETKK